MTSAADFEVVRLSEVERERVEWLWDGYLPRGKLAILDGDPGLGKSTIALDIAARVSRGLKMPPAAPDVQVDSPGDVLIFSSEDGLGDTIGPRLDAAGADDTRVHSVSMHGASVTFPDQLPQLRRLLEEGTYRLVVIDPFMAYLSGRYKAVSDQDVRQVLGPLSEAAAESDASILLVRHLRKQGSDKAIYRGGGSIGIVGQARIGLAVAPHPGDPECGLLAVTKSNLARVSPTLAYRRQDWEGRLPDGSGYTAYRIEWLGEYERTADELLGEPADGRQVDPAVSLLHSLVDATGAIDAKTAVLRLVEAGHVTGPTDPRLRRIRDKAEMVTKKRGFRDGWKWLLRRSVEPEPSSTSSTSLPWKDVNF